MSLLRSLIILALCGVSITTHAATVTKLKTIVIDREMAIPQCAPRNLTNRAILIVAKRCKACKKAKPIVGSLVKQLNLEANYHVANLVSKDGQQMLQKMRLKILFVPTLIVNCRTYIGLKTKSDYAAILKNVKSSKKNLQTLGKTLPLSLFTVMVALVDGVNPCNIFVILLLLGLLLSVTQSKKRVYLIGYVFVAIIFLFYFLFMAAWLSLFRILQFTEYLRVAIGIVAIVAGLINCKELFFFKKAVSLTVRDSSKNILYQKMRKLIGQTSLPALIFSTVLLGIFSSLIELPCTAGFPIIYTSVLASRHLTNSLQHYLYLLFYNLIYVLPLIIIVTILGSTLKRKQLSERQVQIIKFVGGTIMVIIGAILLFWPELIL